MADRPLECSQCKKPLKVIYKEWVDSSFVCTEMCTECPLLESKLHGENRKEKSLEKQGALCCGNCETSLDSVKMGAPLGCTACYAVFEDLLIADLSQSEALPPLLIKQLTSKRLQTIHVGKSPYKSLDVSLSNKLTSLNEALNEALKKENYEQAASLRDQIKAIKEKESG